MKTLTFISAWVCSMLLSANASAQSVTYNFVVADEGTIQLPIWGAEVTSGGVALNLLAAGSETFDNRFAVGPTNRNNESGNCFKFRTSGDWRGLWSDAAAGYAPAARNCLESGPSAYIPLSIGHPSRHSCGQATA